MALSNLALFGGAFFTPVLVGKIATTMGYQWTFYFVAIFAAALLPLLLLCVPETAYRRDAGLDIDTMGNLVGHDTGLYDREVGRDAASSGETEKREEANGIGNADSAPIPAKVTWKQSLMPFNGRKTDERYLHLLLRPFALFAHPGILWVRPFLPFPSFRFDDLQN